MSGEVEIGMTTSGAIHIAVVFEKIRMGVEIDIKQARRVRDRLDQVIFATVAKNSSSQ